MPRCGAVYSKRVGRLFHFERKPMNPFLSRKTARAGLLVAALFLGACVTSNEDKTAVDPQFKNAKVDAQAAGRTLVNSYSQSLQWNSAVTATTGMENLNGI